MNKSLKEAVTLLSVIGIGTAIAYAGVMSYQCATNNEFACPAPFSWAFKQPITTAPQPITTAPQPITTAPAKLIPQGEIPASNINTEMLTALKTILTVKGHTCNAITSGKQVGKDATGVIHNITCDNANRFTIITTAKNYQNPQVYALKPDGTFK